jgi:hypothetical protein
MAVDFSYLDMITIDRFGQEVTVNSEPMFATVERTQKYDDGRGVYFDALEIEYIAAQAPTEIRRGTNFEIDGEQWAVYQKPVITNGWAICTLQKI